VRGRGVAVLVVSILGVWCVSLVESHANAAAPDLLLSVSYPEDTTVNPATAPYSITVNDRRGTGTLKADFRGRRQVLPHWGTADLTFGDAEGIGHVSILRCAQAGDGSETCTDTGHDSPEIEVRRHLSVTDASVYPDGPLTPNGDGVDDDFMVGFHVSTQAPVSVSWEYLRRDGTVAGSGSSTATPGSDGQVAFTTSPAGLPSGEYWIDLAVVADDPDYGRLEGSLADTRPWFTVDLDPPPRPEPFTVDPAEFNPHPDGYRDSIRISFGISSNDAEKGRLTIVDEAGHVVWATGMRNLVDRYKIWLGRDRDGDVVPPGTYQARMKLIDALGNEATYAGPTFTARPERLVKHRLVRTFTPGTDAVDRFVGRCSRLARPAVNGGPGSAGFYSNVRCRGSDQASLVAAVYRLRLPPAKVYNSFWVSVYGRSARSRPRSYGALQYGTVDGWERVIPLESPLEWHEGAHYWAGELLHRGNISFALSTKYGNRYDVRAIKAHLVYSVLE
jgi:hypothetical protein